MRKTDWFTGARFGMFIHWGLYALPGRGEWTRYHHNWDRTEYENLIHQFNPVQFDPDEWAELAYNAGMRYVVFTTKHHDGFCMFDSHFTDFKITNSPYRRDIVRMVAGAFRRRKMKIGFYHSLVDWRHPDFIPDPEHPDWKAGMRDFSARNRAVYQEYLYYTVEQLMTEYGKIDLLFFDYTSKYKTSEEWNCAPLLDMIYRSQPDILVNDRLSFDKKTFPGDYCTPEVCVPNRMPKRNGKPVVWETCASIRENWGYCREDKCSKSTEIISAGLTGCVSKNGNLLLNVGPDGTGRIPADSVTALRDLAGWMKNHAEAVHGAGESSFPPPFAGIYTRKGNALYLYLLQKPIGDMILPKLNGKVEQIKLLRDGSDVRMIVDWGFELLEPDDLRIRPSDALAGDILKITLKN